MTTKLPFLSVGLLFAMLTGSVFAQSLVVDNAYIRGLLPGLEVTAAFFSLNNKTPITCELHGAETPVASSIEMHTHSHQQGVMQMRQLQSITVPAGEAVIFEPGGFHLMLFGVKQPLVVGEYYPLTLFFQGCAEQTVMAQVRDVRH